MNGERSSAPQAAAPTEFLTRSRSEIGSALDELQRERMRVKVILNYKEGELFSTVLKRVDTNAGFFVIDSADFDRNNARVLAAAKVALHADLGRTHLVWVASSPVHTLIGTRSSIKLDFPELLIRHRQRTHPRFRIPAQLKLKCTVECQEFLPFEMEITDISMAGQGMLLSDPAIELPAGTVLRNCVISYPGRRPVVVDLEVRYVLGSQLMDSSGRRRVGCRFIGNNEDVADLVKLFSVKLDVVE